MLQRHVEIFYCLWRLSDRSEKSVGNVCRIGIHNTDPFDVFDVAQGPDQCRQRIDLTEIFPVTRRILCDQDKLFYTLFRKIASLFNDRPEPPRTKRTAHRGDRTERTRSVAAFSNLDE